jgi:hypothetical protein
MDCREDDYLLSDHHSDKYLADNIHRIDLVDIINHNLAAIVPPFDYDHNE